MGRSGVDQGLACGDARMAEVSGDFFVNARGMKQRGGAMEECDERKS
jgi:hypothetical protein